MSGKTKEERYILKLYEMAKQDSENLYRDLDRYLVGQLAGIAPKGTETICKELQRSNFIRRGELDNAIHLTKQGEELALRLIRGS